VASGLLGAGSKFLGTIEESARMLQGFLPMDSKNPDSTSKLAQSLVNEYLMGSKLIPGLGHPDYKRHDPRALRLWDIAKENNLYGKYSRLIASVSEEASRYSRKILPVNLAGAGASVLSDIGFHWSVQRGFALIGRTVGLVGHLWEEMSEPMSANLMDQVRRRVKYKSSMD
jgi:citrate synthase